jgi:8-oxo-dGTP diphosphatase
MSVPPDGSILKLPHKISTLVYAFNQRDELLMLHRRRAPNLGLWSPIGGKLHGDEGESPHQCAARETWEEIGIKARPQDLHLAGIVSERAYEGSTHWLMFMYELKVKLEALPPVHEEGDFEFVPIDQVGNRLIPNADREVLWPLFLKNRGSLFCVAIQCGEDGSLTWQVEETLQ